MTGAIPEIFDAHLHIIDPRFPLIPNQGFIPDAFTVSEYQRRTRDLPITGGAIVSGSFQGTDQQYLLHALAQLGEGFVGVTQLPLSVSDEEILALDAERVRGVRFNLYRGGSTPLIRLEQLALRVHELAGWHVELYVDSSELARLKGFLMGLPRVSIDHLGLTSTGRETLLELVASGVYVKACGFGRVDFDPLEAIQQICDVSSEALMFGTDLPSTRAKIPFNNRDINNIINLLNEIQVRQIFHHNARRFYRLDVY